MLFRTSLCAHVAAGVRRPTLIAARGTRDAEAVEFVPASRPHRKFRGVAVNLSVLAWPAAIARCSSVEALDFWMTGAKPTRA
eukprot:4039653-Pyramimonas_sp.AAC.1